MLPPIEECRVLYATDVRVRLLRPTGEQESIDKGQLVCLWTMEDWTAVTGLYRAFQQALDELARLLVSFGRYPRVLKERDVARSAAIVAAKQTAAGTGLRARPLPAIPNPLTPTVIACPDPLVTMAQTWALPATNWDLPSIRRTPAARHTPMMLAVGSGDPTKDALSSQQGYTLCPSDDAWERVLQVLADATTARGAFLRERERLTTYLQAEQQRPPRSVAPAAHPDQLTLFPEVA